MRVKESTFGAVIQARMNSSRLPGKVLEVLQSEAILGHVYGSAVRAVEVPRIVVATSNLASDDPIAKYCGVKGIVVFRGPLDNVLRRTQLALETLSVDAFFRICADSPFYNPTLMDLAKSLYDDSVDLVSNAFPRSFPKGWTVELANAQRFQQLDGANLSKEEIEHTFSHYYRNPSIFHIKNFSHDKDLSKVNLCIDTANDLSRARIFLERKTLKLLGDISTEDAEKSFGGDLG